MTKELPKAYVAKDYEDEIYKLWEESGFFNPDKLDPKGEPFCVCMPPPNVTGVLHLGHALENALMDTEIRYQRMCGKRALLLPGTDHSAIATQAKVEGLEKAKGIANPREYYGREKLLEIIKNYSEQSKATILKQIRKLGTSCDWSRLAYTFDAERSQTVNKLFTQMYNDGLIYRGYRVINWSVVGQSTCSEDELVYEDQETKVYTFKYSKDFPIAIASTRPETKLGDTAVAVHPEDKRYQKFIGQKFTVDVGAAQPLKITVIADAQVDPEYGTGALGVTPAHSQIDYEMYARNPEIGLIPVIGKDGKMTMQAGKNYQGLTVLEAREKFVAWLKENNLLIKEEKITHNVGTSDRYKDVVEALPMEQWFVNVNKIIPGRQQSLKQLMRAAATEIQIKPERFQKSYLQWVDNLHDWCISRQIWWGHRIPVWYKGTEIFVGEQAPQGSGWEQDPDTLDTWFSSGTWAFSTLGWVENKADLNTFYPTAWMQMGYEILALWHSRMVLFSAYANKTIPYKQVYFHGILRDKFGKKFSKSSGNGIDPLILIDKYGADALRFSVLKGNSPGNDARFYEEKVADARNFVNKLWNVSRYILGKGVTQCAATDLKLSTLPEKWIISSLQNLIKEVSALLEDDQFSLASEKIYEWLWHEFADWYLELNKKAPNDAVLYYCLENILRLSHPFLPFVTEVLWSNLGKKDLLIISSWPKVDQALINPAAEKEFGAWRRAQIKARIKPEELAQEIKKINLEIKSAEQYLMGLMKRLQNQNFLSKAKPEVIALEQERQAETEAKIKALKLRLATLK